MCTYFIMKPQPLYLLFSLLVREQCNAFVHFSIRRDSFRGASHVGAFSLTTRHAAQPLGDDGTSETPTAGMLEELKQEEAKLALMLASVRRQKLAVLRGTICIVSQSSRCFCQTGIDKYLLRFSILKLVHLASALWASDALDSS